MAEPPYGVEWRHIDLNGRMVVPLAGSHRGVLTTRLWLSSKPGRPERWPLTTSIEALRVIRITGDRTCDDC
jgi:hypothetical protein